MEPTPKQPVKTAVQPETTSETAPNPIKPPETPQEPVTGSIESITPQPSPPTPKVETPTSEIEAINTKAEEVSSIPGIKSPTETPKTPVESNGGSVVSNPEKPVETTPSQQTFENGSIEPPVSPSSSPQIPTPQEPSTITDAVTSSLEKASSPVVTGETSEIVSETTPQATNGSFQEGVFQSPSLYAWEGNAGQPAFVSTVTQPDGTVVSGSSYETGTSYLDGDKFTQTYIGSNGELKSGTLDLGTGEANVPYQQLGFRDLGQTNATPLWENYQNMFAATDAWDAGRSPNDMQYLNPGSETPPAPAPSSTNPGNWTTDQTPSDTAPYELSGAPPAPGSDMFQSSGGFEDFLSNLPVKDALDENKETLESEDDQTKAKKPSGETKKVDPSSESK